MTAAICTRNRPELVVRAVASVLQNDHPDFELVVVDQSSTDETQRLLEARFAHDERLHYLHTTRIGVSPARNAAISGSNSEAIAFTDDDCVVPPDWLRTIEQTFIAEPEADLLYGQVLIPDELAGLDAEIPALHLAAPRRISRRDGFALCGMTANCAARRRLFTRLIGFDEVLGPGRELLSGEDFDLNYRAFQAGYLMLASPELTVAHYGVRTREEWRTRLAEYAFGNAAFYMKHVRCGDLRLSWVLCCHLARQSARALLRRPNAASYLKGFRRGVVASLHFGIDHRTRLYVTR